VEVVGPICVGGGAPEGKVGSEKPPSRAAMELTQPQQT
jgi:hypothetical protein